MSSPTAIDLTGVNPETRNRSIKRLVLECVVGSTVHGTSVNDGLEDLDLMAIVLETPRAFMGFSQTDTWVERTKPDGVRSEAGDVDRSIYGLRKYLSLALKGNPTMLLALFVPEEFIRFNSDTGQELQALYPLIVSRECVSPFRGYMKQQHERLLGLRGQRNVTRPELVEAYGYDTKYAGHIIRLGFQGAEVLRTGRLTLPMPPEERDLCVAVRSGKYTLAQVSGLIIEAEERLRRAAETTEIRPYGDREAVQKWMIATYLREFCEGTSTFPCSTNAAPTTKGTT